MRVAGVCVFVHMGEPKSGLHKWSMCGFCFLRHGDQFTPPRQNAMTTSLLLCANLSRHIRVWPRPRLTLSESTTRGGKERGGKRIADGDRGPRGPNGERGEPEFIRPEVHRGGPGVSGAKLCNTLDLNVDPPHVSTFANLPPSELFMQRQESKETTK